MTVRFPTTGAIAGDLYGMVLRELTLCKATSEETVIVFTDTRTNTNYAAAFLAAAKEVSASAFEIKIPLLPGTAGGDTRRGSGGGDSSRRPIWWWTSPPAASFTSTAGRSPTCFQAAPGCSRCAAPKTSLGAAFRTKGVRLRTLNGARKLEEAGEIRVTTETGTDLSMRKDGRRGG